MVVMFMKNFPDGKPTEFLGKILLCFGFDSSSRKIGEFEESGIVEHRVFPKLHTIRQSKRIKAGMMLSFRNWSGKPYNSKQIEFAETWCVSTQDITIFRVHGKLRVWVGDKQLDDNQISKLAVNDGFDSADDFIKYFKKGFCGQIIHWTDLKY